MAEARDRLSRPVDVAELYSRLRHQRSIGRLGIRADNEPTTFLGTPLWRGAAMATTGPMGVAAMATRRASVRGERRGRLGTPSGRRLIGQENTPLMGTTARRLGRGSRSVLYSSYRRSPLQDITTVVGAIERRRARLRETEGQEIGSPLPPARIVHTPDEPTSASQLENEFSHTPHPTIGKRHCLPSSTVGKVPKILLDITSQNAGEPDFLTPQKKLLNSIDKVEKVVMEELRKMERTPTAKKAEREKRVRTLMSMR